jgi:hypothetical protein
MANFLFVPYNALANNKGMFFSEPLPPGFLSLPGAQRDKPGMALAVFIAERARLDFLTGCHHLDRFILP